MKYGFIQLHSSDYPITKLCRFLRVSRSGYYDWLTRKPSRRAQANQQLLEHIRCIHQQSRERYGIMKCWQILLRQGIACGKHRVARLRALHGIYAKRRRRFVLTTRSKWTRNAAPNRLARQFKTDKPNQAWVGDVTFIPTRQGWLYLSVLLDLYSRKVVGWGMSKTNDGKLLEDCLTMALTHRKPPSGLIHHSDRGSNYTAHAFQQRLIDNNVVASMSRKGDCWDNAVAESFFSTLKNELTHEQNFDNHQTARAAIFEYIELFYNRQRLHQTLNYQTPDEFEQGVA